MYSKEKLIDELERVSDEYCNGESPTVQDIRKHSEFTEKPYCRIFGSWNECLKECGFSVNRGNDYDKNDLIESIKDIPKELHSVNGPTIETFTEETKYNTSNIYNVFDSWNEALGECGFSSRDNRGYIKKATNSELFEEIERISTEHCDGGTPEQSDMNEYGKYHTSTYIRRFGCWNNAVYECGFQRNIRKNIRNEELKEELDRLSEEYSSPPTISLMKKHGKFNSGTYVNRFGSWRNALEKFGFEAREWGEWVPSGEDDPKWKGGCEGYYGPSWNSQRQKALERDEYSCQSCGISKEEINKNPDVHHIKPARRWDIEEEHEKMNSLDNLITLCRKCHSRYEGEWQEMNSANFKNKIK